MISTSDKAVSVIKDLIIINNDRQQGYKTASEEVKDQDLKSLFAQFSNDSNGYNSELRKFIPDEEDVNGETTTSGKVYRIWMDVRTALSSNDRKAALSSCEYGEDVASAAYRTALESDDLSEEIRTVIRKQRDEQQDAHNRIKALRDQA
jgi:uncharacterized protein (TIGR02284 family)